MVFDYKDIKKHESIAFEFFKLFLLIQVVIGHAIALSLPKVSEINLNEFENYFILVFKMIFSFGRESAYIFIFISGFFTSKIFLNKKTKFNLLSFLKKRIIRIYPIYTIALILTFIFDYLGFVLLNFEVYSSNAFNINLYHTFSLKIFLLNFFSLQPVFVSSFGSNSPIWTLGYLVQFFFLATFLFKLSIKFNINWKIIMFFFIFLVGFINIEFSLLFLIWFLGVLSKKIYLPNIYLNIFITVTFVFVLLIFQKMSEPNISMILTPLTTFFVFLFINNLPKKSSSFLSKFERFPDVSYVLYAIHMPVLFMTYGISNLYIKSTYFSDFAYILVSFILSIILSFFVLKLNNKLFIK
jgi:peptidoglycan/LPS O-acetylase OafA/YrhL